MPEDNEKKKMINVENNSMESSDKKNEILDRVMESVDKAVEKGSDKISSAIVEKSKIKSDENDKQRAHENVLNKRNTLFAALIFIVFSAMWFTAFLSGNSAVANTVMMVLLATAAGAGLTKIINPK